MKYPAATFDTVRQAHGKRSRQALRGIYCHSGLDPESNLQMDSRIRGNDAC
jgi:hypothetical protein